MNVPNPFVQLRPFLTVVGSVMIVLGLLDWATVIRIPFSGIEIAIAGFLIKHV